MKEFDKKIKSRRNILKAIGILEIIGGVTGFKMLYSIIIGGFEFNSIVILILLLITGFYGYSIFAGLKLFTKMEKEIIHSQIIQYLQIFAISFGGMTYFLTSGGYLMIGFNMTNSNIGLDFSALFSDFQIFIENSTQDSYVYLNIMAIIILNLIEKAKKEIELQIEIKENYLKRLYE
tara:strand:+ start:4093 stop:4623 length:531 start_codon:yes stop_codon:yes gene_type:complete